MLTERFDARAMQWLIEEASAADFVDAATSAPLLSPRSNYAKLQGMGDDATFSIERLLQALKHQLKEHKKHGGKVHYRYGTNFADSKGGRLIANTGYQNWPGAVRATLARSLYHDVDIVNAQPTLLLAIAQKHGWACATLGDYVANRETHLQALMDKHGIDHSQAKAMVLSVLCGGKVTDGISTPFLHAMHAEVGVMAEAAYALDEYSAYKAGVAASQERKRKALGKRAVPGYNNEQGALLAVVMQSLERLVIMAVRDGLQEKGHSVDTLIHDGCLVQRRAGEDSVPDAVLRAVEEKVLAVAGVAIVLAVKPWGPGLTVPDEPPVKPIKVGRLQPGGAGGKKRKRGGGGDGDGGGEDGEEKELAPGVSRSAYEAMRAEFEQHHFYYVPGNTFVEVTEAGMRHYEQRHAKEYFDIKWAFGGTTNFRYRVSFLDLWRLDPARRSIHTIDFNPSDDPAVFYYPIKFAYERVKPALALEDEGEEARAARAIHEGELLDMFRTLARVATNGDATLGEYLLNFLAHMLQKPTEQPGVAIILTGQKGVGKDTLLDFFRMYVIGPAFSHNYTETRQFFDKHDVDRKDKLMLKVEDSDSALCKAHAKDLRARITARESTVNPKGKDPITYNNYARYFFTANQAIPVGINDDNDRERRFVILAVSSELKNNATFFTKCYNEKTGLFTPLGGRVVAESLLGRDLSAFNPRIQPRNEYQESLYEVERSPEQRFIEDGWRAGVEYKSQDLFQVYLKFCSDQGFPKWTETAIAFGQKMAYFVLHRKIVKRTGSKKQVYYSKPVGSMPESDDEEEEGAGAGAGAGGGRAPGGGEECETMLPAAKAAQAAAGINGFYAGTRQW
jgi:hypothetical protein